MPQRPSRKKKPAPAKAPGPEDIQTPSDRRAAEEYREKSVRHIVGKFQGRKSI